MQPAKSKGPLAPVFDVAVKGKSLPAETIAYITDLTVDQSVELPDMFTFALASSDAQNTKFPWIDNQDLFVIGNPIEIKMGNPGALASVMIGEITSLDAEFVSNRLPSLNVRGYDRRHRLQRGRKTRSFIQQKDSDIASQIGGEAGLTVQATDTGTSLDYVLQANQTDWEFLCVRASQIRYEVVVQDKTLLFQPVANDQSEVLTLDMEHGLLEFYPRLSSAGQVTEVKVQGWSVKDKKALLGDAKGGDEVSAMGGSASGAALAQKAFGAAIEIVSDRPVGAQAEADQLAKARFNELVLELISGEGACQGRTDLRAGKVIKIDGIGQRFGGQYYITGAVHRYSASRGYVTEFVVRRNAS
jgi:phage protein D